jgi:hypothetical protein
MGASEAVEWAGAIVGMLGAVVLATHSRISRWGWVAFLVSNVLLIALTASIGRWGLLAMQLGYLGTSVLGIFRAFPGVALWIRAPSPGTCAQSLGAELAARRGRRQSPQSPIAP